jgi:hypothetical protein
VLIFSGRIGKAGRAEKAEKAGKAGRIGVRAGRAIVGQVRQVGRERVRAARAIVGRVGCKKEIFICGLKNNPYLCGCLNQ